ncbi:MAG TPA: regulatory iron-sulfur-containing complex subunit RicT, partial [Saprospiraceae bacterium]|nr:regulatory iron-sulfur-containing complex subunit RicT [Saprospiraceae bacterium]
NASREFKVKIEMRQIGARQESARIGGIGSCGRELCCSTWLSDFKSVNTAAARYQNIAINQSKLSGQCGRLKCCLNYELDTYLDALEDFPEDADQLKTKAGSLVLIKTDIFKGLLYYVYENNDKMRGTILPVSTTRAKEVKALNKKGIIPDELGTESAAAVLTTNPDDENVEHGYEDVTGLIELKNDKKKKKRPQRKDDRRPPKSENNQAQPQKGGENQPKEGRPDRNFKPNPNKNQGQNPNQQKNTPQGDKRPTDIQKDANKNVNDGVKGNVQPNGDEAAQPKLNKKKKFFNKNRKPKDGPAN